MIAGLGIYNCRSLHLWMLLQNFSIYFEIKNFEFMITLKFNYSYEVPCNSELFAAALRYRNS